jgi:GST-like protein
VFESGAILLYLAEKFGAFLPKDPSARTEALNWLFWQMGAGPFVGGGFGHFYMYAPVKIQYAIDRYAMEVKRQYDVLDRHLANNRFMAGAEYSIADMAIWPWYGAIALGQAYGDAASFLSLKDYRHFNRWVDEVAARPAVQRGRRVNRKVENDPSFIRERHSAADLD